MSSAIYQLTLARLREFMRQGEAVFWVFLFPILLALVLGFAFKERGPEPTPVGVVRGPDSATIEAALKSSPVLDVAVFELNEGREALRTGKISLLVEHGSPVVYRFDPDSPESRTARLETDDALQRAAGRQDPLPVEEVTSTEQGGRYIDFLIPGLIGLNLMGTGMWSVGFSVATARMQKLLKRLIATPMRKRDYLLSHMLSRFIFLVLELVVLVAFGWIVFDVAIRGSILLFIFVALLGAFSFTALGLLTAARADSIEAVSGWMNLVMVPMWVLSGVFFSAERFPEVAQPFIQVLPLTALNDALRAIMNEAQPLAALWGDIVILAVWGLVTFVFALKIFKWR